MSVIKALARRDGLIVAMGLAAVTVLAWAYLFVLANGMAVSSGSVQTIMMPELKPWDPADFLFMFVMWAVMMSAMMIPSAAPMILFYAAFARKVRPENRSVVRSGAFASGYLVIWAGFSAAATVLQWCLEQAALLSPTMVGASPYFGGVLLIAAGLYQLTPLKRVCLQHCRSPVRFLTRHWRKGASGAFQMGLDHGLYCVGCCWILMALLFVGGVMNLLWIAILAVFVLLEKIIPRGDFVGRAAGNFGVLAGLLLILQA